MIGCTGAYRFLMSILSAFSSKSRESCASKTRSFCTSTSRSLWCIGLRGRGTRLSGSGGIQTKAKRGEVWGAAPDAPEQHVVLGRPLVHVVVHAQVEDVRAGKPSLDQQHARCNVAHIVRVCSSTNFTFDLRKGWLKKRRDFSASVFRLPFICRQARVLASAIASPVGLHANGSSLAA